MDTNFVQEYQGIGDVFKKVIKLNGIKGLYQGLLPHLMRNIPGGAMHLGTFEYVRIKSAEYENVSIKNLPLKYSILGGALGIFFYFLIFFLKGKKNKN
jgi:hypothetical protein